MNDKKFQVAIIILNYNSSDYTLDCVKSIRENSPKKITHQILIVDNNSSNEEYGKLNILSEQEDIKIIRSDVNLGFAGGNMAEA